MARRIGLSPSEQRLVLCVALLLLTGAAGWVGWPLWVRLQEVEERVHLSQQKMVKLRELAADAPSIEQAHVAYATFMTTESDEAAHRAFLEELEELAREGNLQLSLKPGRVEQQGRISRLGVEVEADATQEELLAFLDRVLSWSGLIELDRMRLSATASQESPLKGQFSLSRVVVRP